MDNLSCPSKYCRYWGEYEYCHCRAASRSGSAATVQECRAYRKMMEDQKKEQELQKERNA